MMKKQLLFLTCMAVLFGCAKENLPQRPDAAIAVGQAKSFSDAGLYSTVGRRIAGVFRRGCADALRIYEIRGRPLSAKRYTSFLRH